MSSDALVAKVTTLWQGIFLLQINNVAVLCYALIHMFICSFFIFLCNVFIYRSLMKAYLLFINLSDARASVYEAWLVPDTANSPIVNHKEKVFSSDWFTEKLH